MMSQQAIRAMEQALQAMEQIKVLGGCFSSSQYLDYLEAVAELLEQEIAYMDDDGEIDDLDDVVEE